MKLKPAPQPEIPYDQLFHALPGLYVLLSPDLQILNATDSFLEATGTTRQIIGKEILEVFPDTPPGAKALLQQAWAAALQQQSPYNLPAIQLEPHGKGNLERFWHMAGKPLTNQQGQVQYILHELQQVSETSTESHDQQLYREHNERFARIAKATNDVIWDWNLQNDTIWWNDGFQDLFGYTPQEIEPTISSWNSRIHPDDFERVKSSIYRVISSGQTNWEEQYRFRCADGRYMLIHDKGYVLRNHTGEPIRMVGAMVDITRKAQVEQELQESVHHAQQILDSLPLMTWTAKPDGYVNYYNKRWFEYTGATAAELQDWQWRNFIHPDDFEHTQETWLQALETGKPFENQSRWLSAADGSYRWFLGRGVPIHDSNGQITLWVGSNTDIEDQKQMLDALEESTHKFRFLAESIPQIVWTTDPSGYHDYFNQRWTDYTGLSQEQSIGFNWRDVLHPEDYQRASERWQHSLRTGEYYEIEYRFRNGKDGSYRWFLGQAMPMRDARGKVIKWFGTCTDIEDHKKAEEELQEKNLELERINYDLDSFVYTASHDLKLPIINMAGIFEELTRSADFTDPEAQTMIEMFNRSLNQIHNTINDLSEVVRVQKTKARDMELVDLEELTEEIKTSIHDSLTDSGTIILTDFESAPAIAFSRANLKSIFFNLITNAIKYRDHSRPAQIKLSTNRKGEYVELLVQDNGLGINMDKHQNKLFKLFKRFHNHVNGSGLGLYIVNRLLTNSGGYINVESKLNEGTTFYLYFKQKQA